MSGWPRPRSGHRRLPGGRGGRTRPACGTRAQRIRHAGTETDYRPRCQTGGKLPADRSLSALLKKDWPKSIEALERRRGKD
ncbi:MAG: hypothetical protein RH942_04440 [Kiloniellaceae bacterium]